MMRAKMRVTDVSPVSEGIEQLNFTAVAASSYPEDGSDENNTYAQYTPLAELSMEVKNPILIGKFAIGDEYYLDFTKAG